MKKTLLIIFISLCFSQAGRTQINLVPNPSFEDYIECPYNFGGNNLPLFWYAFRPSPDYFHTCATNWIVSIPTNAFGFQIAANGNAYCGLASYHPSNWNELIGCKLLDTLIIGSRYYISFKASLAGSSPCAINNLGILFSTKSYCDSLDIYNVCYSEPLTLTNFAHIYTTQFVTDTTEWTIIEGSFIADSAYQYIIIGNLFEYDLTTDTLLYGNTSCFSNSIVYYYIDDIYVGIDTTVTVVKYDFEKAINIYPNPATDIINITIPYNNFATIEIYNVFGKLVSKKKTSEIDNTIHIGYQSSGIYFIKVQIENRVITKKIILTNKN